MITYTSIRYKNFLSTGNVFTEVDLESFSKTLIIGKNGSGKSTLLDALCFSLFGKPFREINKPQLVNTITKKDCLVEVEFITLGDKYLIRRGIKPNIFEIFKNGEQLNQNAKVDDQQEVLEKHILKCNLKTFKSVMILGAATYTPFMELATPQKREVIEELLDLQIFSVMNVLLKKKVSDNNSLIQDREWQYTSIQNEIENINKLLKINQAQSKDEIESIQEKIKVENAKVVSLQNTLDHLTAEIQDYYEAAKKFTSKDELKKLINQLNAYESKFKGKKMNLNSDLKFLQDNENCPSCKQGIPHDHKETIITDVDGQLKELDSNLEKLYKKRDKVQDELSRLDEILQTIDSLERSCSDHRVEIKNVQNMISFYNKKITEINSKNTEINTNLSIVDKNIELTAVSRELEELRKEKKLFAISATLLKDTGIKARIIKEYIPVINSLINKYLETMNFMVSFELTENFDEIIKSRYRDNFSYASFSEGEKFRINLAILFAWREIARMRNSVSSNLLIMDEVLDGSLDDDGNVAFFKLLEDTSQSTNVYVISHNIEGILDQFDRMIEYKKVKNFSQQKVVEN